MPNGFSGPRDRYIELIRTIERLDPALTRFARRYGLALRENPRLEFGRYFQFANDDFVRTILVFPTDDYSAWNIKIRAETIGRQPPLERSTFLRHADSIENLEAELPDLLEKALQQLLSWTVDDLSTSDPT